MSVRLRQVLETTNGVPRFRAEVCTAMDILPVAGLIGGQPTECAGMYSRKASARNSLKVLALDLWANGKGHGAGCYPLRRICILSD